MPQTRFQRSSNSSSGIRIQICCHGQRSIRSSGENTTLPGQTSPYRSSSAYLHQGWSRSRCWRSPTFTSPGNRFQSRLNCQQVSSAQHQAWRVEPAVTFDSKRLPCLTVSESLATVNGARAQNTVNRRQQLCCSSATWCRQCTAMPLLNMRLQFAAHTRRIAADAANFKASSQQYRQQLTQFRVTGESAPAIYRPLRLDLASSCSPHAHNRLTILDGSSSPRIFGFRQKRDNVRVAGVGFSTDTLRAPKPQRFINRDISWRSSSRRDNGIVIACNLQSALVSIP